MSGRFWLGVMLAFCYQNFIQDMIGKEKYLKAIDVLWIDCSPWIWVVFGVIFIIADAFGPGKEKKS